MTPDKAPFNSETPTTKQAELPTISYSDFEKVHIHVGTVLNVEINKKARNPAYVLTVDFGQEFGIKTSSAQLVGNYTPEDLNGRQVVAVLNFPPKNVAGVKSEALVLGALCSTAGTVILSPLTQVENGSRIL